MKKRLAKKASNKFDFSKIIKILFLVLLVLFIAAQIAVDRYLLTQTEQSGDSRIQNLIIEAVRGLNKEAVVDGPTGKVYLPDARLVLPAYPEEVQGILYSQHYSGENMDEKQLQITSKQALNYGISRVNAATTLEGTFDAVPKLQACSRQVLITFKPDSELDDTAYHQIHTQKLADGREVFMYADTGCEENSEALIAYLKQLQSY